MSAVLFGQVAVVFSASTSARRSRPWRGSRRLISNCQTRCWCRSRSRSSVNSSGRSSSSCRGRRRTVVEDSAHGPPSRRRSRRSCPARPRRPSPVGAGWSSDVSRSALLLGSSITLLSSASWPVPGARAPGSCSSLIAPAAAAASSSALTELELQGRLEHGSYSRKSCPSRPSRT